MELIFSRWERTELRGDWWIVTCSFCFCIQCGSYCHFVGRKLLSFVCGSYCQISLLVVGYFFVFWSDSNVIFGFCRRIPHILVYFGARLVTYWVFWSHLKFGIASFSVSTHFLRNFPTSIAFRSPTHFLPAQPTKSTPTYFGEQAKELLNCSNCLILTHSAVGDRRWWFNFYRKSRTSFVRSIPHVFGTSKLSTAIFAYKSRT